MSTGAFIGLLVAIVVVAAIVVLIVKARQRRHLREQFGSEYDRALEHGESRRAAERELAEREKRHAELDIKPLSDGERERHASQWALIQERFVDSPSSAVVEADRLVTVVMGERGYPTEGYQQQVTDLSVRHASTLDHYREAHEIKTRHDESEASTEELREAMVHYRSLFEDLLDTDVNQRRRN